MRILSLLAVLVFSATAFGQAPVIGGPPTFSCKNGKCTAQCAPTRADLMKALPTLPSTLTTPLPTKTLMTPLDYYNQRLMLQQQTWAAHKAINIQRAQNRAAANAEAQQRMSNYNILMSAQRVAAGKQ
jgi:hypothetical protein